MCTNVPSQTRSPDVSELHTFAGGVKTVAFAVVRSGETVPDKTPVRAALGLNKDLL